jgi:transcriptional regulator of acetoin/glycerol metabolism
MKKKKKDLEETLKEKVSPLLEETMEKSLGVTIPKIESDITDQLSTPLLDMYIPFQLNFTDAKKSFKKQFFKRELRLHLGNVSELSKFMGLDRRSIHRTIKDLDISMENLRAPHEAERYKETIVDQTIRSTLEGYREIIKPEKMENMYKEVSHLSRNIAKVLGHHHLTWKQAEHEFEKQFLEHLLQENGWNITQTAKKIGLRAETLHRKIKKLGIKK